MTPVGSIGIYEHRLQLEQHTAGEKHKMTMRRMERYVVSDPELDKDINPYNLPEQWLRERKHCNLCDVQVSNLRLATLHFNSRFLYYALTRIVDYYRIITLRTPRSVI